MEEKKERSAVKVVAVVVGVCLVLMIIANYGATHGSASSAPQTPATPAVYSPPAQAAAPVTRLAPEVAEPAPAPEPEPEPASSHNYSMEEDGEYGYERALSQDERNAGKVTSSLVMFRYLGIKDGSYVVQTRSGPSVQTASCKSPCEFVKMKTFYAGELVESDTVRATPGSIVAGVLEDAQNGMLETYKSSPQL